MSISMIRFLSAFALSALCACTLEREPLGDTVFIEEKYKSGCYAGTLVHKTAECSEIDGGVQPKKMTRYAGWYEASKAIDGPLEARYMADRLFYCTNCLSESEIKQLDRAFYKPVRIVRKQP